MTVFRLPPVEISGDAEQTYEMAKFVWEMSKEFNNRSILVLFPLEYLKTAVVNGKKIWLEDISIDAFNWERSESLTQAHQEVYHHE